MLLSTKVDIDYFEICYGVICHWPFDTLNANMLKQVLKNVRQKVK